MKGAKDRPGVMSSESIQLPAVAELGHSRATFTVEAGPVVGARGDIFMIEQVVDRQLSLGTLQTS